MFFNRKKNCDEAILAELRALRARLDDLPTIEQLRAVIKEQNGLIIAMGAFAESEDKIFDIFYEGVKTRFYLPNGASDRTQTDIIRTSGFYQARPLRHIYRSKLVKPGATVIDVGANIGNHTLFFANVMGSARVHAFEPNPMVLPILKKNIDLNGLFDVVDLKEIGLGASEARGRNQLPTTSHIGRNEVIEDQSGDIEIRRLDDLGIEAVDFMKIDVEGHGAGVLLGGWELIGRHKPIILMEATSEAETEAVEDLKAAFGYKESKRFAHDVLLTV